MTEYFLPEELIKIIISLLSSLEKVVWLRVSQHFLPFIEESAKNIKRIMIWKKCREGDDLSLRFLRNHKLDFNYGLFGACLGGHLSIVELMISKGANDLNGGLHNATICSYCNIIKT